MSSLNNVMLNVARNNGCCESLTRNGGIAVNWVREKGRGAIDFFSATASKIIAFAKTQFANLREWTSNLISSLTEAYKQNPRVFHVAGITAAISVVTTAILCKVCRKKEEAPVENPPQGAEQPPVNNQQQPQQPQANNQQPQANNQQPQAQAPAQQPQAQAPAQQPQAQAPAQQPQAQAPAQQPQAQAPVQQPQAQAPVQQPQAQAPVQQPQAQAPQQQQQQAPAGGVGVLPPALQNQPQLPPVLQPVVPVVQPAVLANAPAVNQ